jgi:hypothetical protein
MLCHAQLGANLRDSYFLSPMGQVTLTIIIKKGV